MAAMTETQKQYWRDYHMKNRERILNRQHERYRQNREKVMERGRQWRIDNPRSKRSEEEKRISREREREYRHSSPRAWFQDVKKSARDRGIPFELTLEECRKLFGGKCIYCGELSENGRNGIDRVDNELGYISSNVASCCRICNVMKLTYTIEFFLSHIRKILNHREVLADKKLRLVVSTR